MKFIDLGKQYSRIQEKVNDRIQTVLDHGQYILGPEVRELEQQLAAYAGVDHCVSCSSGTDALLMPLMAWGIGPGDAVFTTPFTFIATAEMVRLLGATPVFVDIDPDTLNIDPALVEPAIEKVKAEGKLVPRAILPVDIFGLPADYDAIEPIARKHKLLVLEDGAQSFGGAIGRRKACSFGQAAATSFFPAKPLGGYGDGGAVFTNDEALKARLLSIRVHGQGEDKYQNVRLGINGRLDTLQAAILLEKLAIFDGEIALRRQVAAGYARRLRDKVTVPKVPENYTSVWAQYSPLAESEQHREEILARLGKAGIPTAVYYRLPLHLQEAFADLGWQAGDFPMAEDVSRRVFSLPMHPYLTEEEIDGITRCI